MTSFDGKGSEYEIVAFCEYVGIYHSVKLTCRRSWNLKSVISAVEHPLLNACETESGLRLNSLLLALGDNGSRSSKALLVSGIVLATLVFVSGIVSVRFIQSISSYFILSNSPR